MSDRRDQRQTDTLPGQLHQRQESPFLTRLPAEIRIMIYHCALPGQAIHLGVDRTRKVTGKICGSEPDPATKPKFCYDCFSCGCETVRHQLLALPFSCQQIRAEILPIYQAKIFVVEAVLLQRIYRSLAVFTSRSSSVSRFNPFQRLQVEFWHSKGGSKVMATQRAECLQTVVENKIDANEICITFQHQDRLLKDLFPLTRSAILTLGKLRGLRNFRILFKDGLNKQSGHLALEPAFQNKVAAVEQIFREFACAGVGNMPGLDRNSQEMTRSDTKFLNGFRVKLEQILQEKYKVTRG